MAAVCSSRGTSVGERFQQPRVQRLGGRVVVVGRVHAGQGRHGQGLVGLLGQQRGQGVIRSHQVARLAQAIGLAHDVGAADVGETAALALAHGGVLQLAQDA